MENKVVIDSNINTEPYPCYELLITTENSRIQTEDCGHQSLNGTDLFSIFTADIIREEVLFTR